MSIRVGEVEQAQVVAQSNFKQIYNKLQNGNANKIQSGFEKSGNTFVGRVEQAVVTAIVSEINRLSEKTADQKISPNSNQKLSFAQKLQAERQALSENLRSRA